MTGASTPPTAPQGHLPRLVADLAREGITRVESFAWRDLDDPDAGGSEVYMDNVLRLWAAAGLDVVHRTSTADAPRTFVRHGYRVEQRGGRYGVFPRVILPRLVRRRPRGTAVVEAWNGVPWFSPLWRADLRIVYLHHIHEDMWAESLPAPLAPVGRLVETRIAPRFYRSTHVATLAPTTRARLLELGFRPDRVRVIEPAIDDSFGPDDSPRANAPLVVAVGRLAPVKRFVELVHAFRDVVDAHPTARLVIVGEGPERENIAAAVSDTGLTGRVDLVGRIPHDDLVRLYRSAWLVTGASHSEGWGLTITEAGACGTPAVVTDNDGHRVAVVDGVTGVLVAGPRDLGPAIARIIADADVRAGLSRAALEHNSRFRWERTAALGLEMMLEAARARRG